MTFSGIPARPGTFRRVARLASAGTALTEPAGRPRVPLIYPEVWRYSEGSVAVLRPSTAGR